jgi:hypothetical protein
VYRAHLERLAREHGIDLTYVEYEPGRGWLGQAHPWDKPPRILTLEPVDRDALLVGLHELGHVLAYPDGWQSYSGASGAPSGGTLVAELAAWRWAFQNSPVQLTGADADMVLQRQYDLARRAGATSRFGAELVPPVLRPRYEDTLRALELLYAGHLAAWHGNDE